MAFGKQRWRVVVGRGSGAQEEIRQCQKTSGRQHDDGMQFDEHSYRSTSARWNSTGVSRRQRKTRGFGDRRESCAWLSSVLVAVQRWLSVRSEERFMQRCPKCDSAMRVKRSKTGREFLSCLRWPDCDGARNMDAGTTPSEALAPQTIRLSPRTQAAIAITAQMAAAQGWDSPEQIVADAMAITRCLMAALKADNERIMEARVRASNDDMATTAGEAAGDAGGNESGVARSTGVAGMGSQA